MTKINQILNQKEKKELIRIVERGARPCFGTLS